MYVYPYSTFSDIGELFKKRKHSFKISSSDLFSPWNLRWRKTRTYPYVSEQEFSVAPRLLVIFQLHFHQSPDSAVEEKEVDFFEEHEKAFVETPSEAQLSNVIQILL